MSEHQRLDVTALKVLVVGDNAFERRLVMDLLIALGVRSIFTADDGVAAFAQLTIKKPDMVIADAEMGPLSGFALAREIRAAPIGARGVPIVLFTKEASPDFAIMARAAGATEVLAKPVSALALRQSLEDAARRPPVLPAATPKRVQAPPDAKSAAPDRHARAAVIAAIDEARAGAARWSVSGEPALLVTIAAAINRAAAAGQGDAALCQALAGAARLADAAQSGMGDPRLLDVSLSAARAMLAAPAARNAMRQALAEAIFEAVENRPTTTS